MSALFFFLSATLSTRLRNFSAHGLQSMEWNRRIALEKELNKSEDAFRHLKLTYDFSGNFLLYSTPLGISVYNTASDTVVREIGKGENARFMAISLSRALPDSREFLQGSAPTMNSEVAENPNLKRCEPDPLLVSVGGN